MDELFLVFRVCIPVSIVVLETSVKLDDDGMGVHVNPNKFHSKLSHFRRVYILLYLWAERRNCQQLETHFYISKPVNEEILVQNFSPMSSNPLGGKDIKALLESMFRDFHKSWKMYVYLLTTPTPTSFHTCISSQQFHLAQFPHQNNKVGTRLTSWRKPRK